MKIYSYPWFKSGINEEGALQNGSFLNSFLYLAKMSRLLQIELLLSPYTLFQFCSIGVGLVVVFYLIYLSTRLKWYIPLVVFVLLNIFETYIDILTGTGWIKHFPHLLYVSEPFYMLFGILVYLYARSQEQQKFLLQKKDLLLLAPFLLALITYSPYYILNGQEKLADFLEYGEVKTDINENIWEWIFLVSVNITFLGAALHRFDNFTNKVKDLVSDIHKLDFHFTRILIKACIGLFLIELFFVFLTWFGFPYYETVYNLYDLAKIVIFLLIAYDAISSHKHLEELQQGWQNIHPPNTETGKSSLKYARSGLTPESSAAIRLELERFMHEKKPYLQSQLRLKHLSDETGIGIHQISQVINECFEQNFYDFVNTYRVDQAKALLLNSKFADFTYSAIGFEAGFNSKSAFYNAFKKVTGTTPAQYQALNSRR